MARVAAFLPMGAEDVSPSPSVKDSLLERIASEPRALPVGVVRPRWAWAGTVAAAAALLLAVGAFFGALLWGGDGGGAIAERREQLVRSVAQGTASRQSVESGGMQAVLLHAPGSQEGFAWLEGLPALPAGKAYQAWFTRDGQVFEPSAVFSEGGGVWMSAGASIEEYAAMGLTIEDDDGADVPSSAPFVVVNLRDAAKR